MFKNQISNESGNYCNHKIFHGKNIFNSKKQSLTTLICTSKFPHQKVGIKKDNDEPNLNNGSPNWSKLFVIPTIHRAQLYQGMLAAL